MLHHHPRPAPGVVGRAGLGQVLRVGLALGLLLSGCVKQAKVVGLIDASAPTPVLVDTEGKRYRLGVDAGSDEEQLQQLAGCGVLVEGAVRGRRLEVDRYRVMDAGDGSAPFVGQLRFERGALVLHDRQGAGALRVLAAEGGPSLAELQGLVGQDVVLIGFVASAQAVVAMRWRALGPALPPAPR
ncbi:MAG: hypothetical protein JNM72_01215 [Deltaproteobacteria bacterium]|nr:hypothetical protein [Deltaproteobacteria bacterium]